MSQMHHLSVLLALIAGHSLLAYVAIFAASLCESLALVGLLVPGTVIMVGVGAIVATGSLKLMPTLFLAMAGAIAGDGISYWLGHHYKEKLERIWPFSRYPEIFKKGEAFFRRHGGKSVLLGRFIGAVRPIIPVVAGIMGMEPGAFFVVNVLSAIGWALVYILPGVIFGTSLIVIGTISVRLVIVGFLLVGSIWGFVWICRKLPSLFERKFSGWLLALRRWTEGSSSFSFIRLVKKSLYLLLFRGREGEEWLVIFLAILLLAAGWGFWGVFEDVLTKDPLVVADESVFHFFQSLRTSWSDNVFVSLTELGDPVVSLSLFGVVLAVFLLNRCYRTAKLWTITSLGGIVGVQLLKLVVHMKRPVAIYHGASLYSFPSGHVTMSVVLYGFLAILLSRESSGAWRWKLFSSVFLISFVIGFSRLYLGVHWLSDVLGGYFIGTSWVAFMGIVWLKSVKDERIPRRLLGTSMILAIAIAGGWHISQNHTRDLLLYAPRHEEKVVLLSHWQAGGWRELPVWRIDMEGKPEQPLTVQWAWSPSEIAKLLESKGWRRPPALGPKSLIAIFAGDASVERLPLFPQFHAGMVECLCLVYPGHGDRFVLRLWSTDVRINENGATLLVGNVEEQKSHSFADLFVMARDTGNYSLGLRELERSLGGDAHVKKVYRGNSEVSSNAKRKILQWQGELLLVW